MKTYKHYILYKITNLINGKIYIGKHMCDVLDDKYFGSGKRLWLAINKYGIENFVFELLIDLKNSEEMDLLEECVVNKEFLARNDVYNISKGGKNPCMYGKDNPFYGKTHTNEFKEKISKVHKGKHISKEHRQNISNGLKKLYLEHPEICLQFASKKDKKQCKSKTTGKIKFFKLDEIPDDFEIYLKPKQDTHVPLEKKIENQRLHSERNKKSKWYNNGVQEKFCLPENVPEGFVLGRLPTINVGRTYSEETIQKMRNAKIGKPTSNKGKIFITNGYDNKYISKTDVIPDGWWHGMTRRNSL